MDRVSSRVEACALVRPSQFVLILLGAQRRLSRARTAGGLSAAEDQHSTEPQPPSRTQRKKRKAEAKEDENRAKKKHKQSTKEDAERSKEPGSLVFGDLPAEVVTHIITFVDQPQDLHSLLLVDSNVHALASANAVWEGPYRASTSATAQALLDEAGVTSANCTYYELAKLIHLIHRAKLRLVSTSEAAGSNSAGRDDPSGHRYVMRGYCEWPGNGSHCGADVLPRSLEDRHGVRARLLLSGDMSFSGQPVAFYGMTITHRDAPALRTRVPIEEGTHVDCSVGSGAASGWLTLDQKEAIVRFLLEVDYHGPYEWVVALRTT